jgi:hypothetical protein
VEHSLNKNSSNAIQTNPLIIKKYVEDAVDLRNENIQELQDEFREEFETLNQNINGLLLKAKKIVKFSL